MGPPDATSDRNNDAAVHDGDQQHDRGHEHHGHAPLAASAHATGHCLIGCFIGEAIGVAIGVTLALGTALTIAAGVFFAYVFGFALALIPLVRRMDMSVGEAMRVVWLGEAVSIAAMEVAMNGIDYAVGGLQAGSIAEPVFWLGLAAAAPAGFFAAWPVNHWLLKKQIKTHH